MTIITLHHLCFGHCVNSSVIVLDLGIFLRELRSLRKIPRSKTITSDFTQWPQKRWCAVMYCLMHVALSKHRMDYSSWQYDWNVDDFYWFDVNKRFEWVTYWLRPFRMMLWLNHQYEWLGIYQQKLGRRLYIYRIDFRITLFINCITQNIKHLFTCFDGSLHSSL